MRSDFEILGYNIIQWLCGSLPWEKNLKDPSAVQKQKEQVFLDIQKFLKQCFTDNVPRPITEYMKLLSTLKYNDTPNYAKFRKILVDGLWELGSSPDGKLEFSSPAKPSAKSVVTPRKTKKTTETAQKRKSPRVKPPKSPSPSRSVGSLLDESTIGVVVDKKREGVKGLRKILESIDDDSDAEYDICITKKRKAVKRQEETAQIPSPPKKGRRRPIVEKTLDSSANSEPEVKIHIFR